MSSTVSMRFVSSDSSLNHVSKVTNSDQLDEELDKQLAALLVNKKASIVISRDGANLPGGLQACQVHFKQLRQGLTSPQRNEEMQGKDLYVESLRFTPNSHVLLGRFQTTSQMRNLTHSVHQSSSNGTGIKWIRITSKSSDHNMMQNVHKTKRYGWQKKTEMIVQALADNPAGYFGLESIPVVVPNKNADTPRQTKTDRGTQEDQSGVVTTKWRDRSAPQEGEQVPLSEVSRATAFFDPKRSYSSVAAMIPPNKRILDDVNRDTITQTGRNNVNLWRSALLQSTSSVQAADSRPVGKTMLKRPQPAQTARQDSKSQSQSSCAEKSSSRRRDVYKQGTGDTQHSEHGVTSKAAEKFELRMKYNVEADFVRRKIRETLLSGTILDGSGETLTLQRANVSIPSEDDMARGKEYVDLCNPGDGVDRPYLLESWGLHPTAGTARRKHRASWNEVVSAGESLLRGYDVHWLRASEFDPDCDRSSLARDSIPASRRMTQTTSNPQMKAVANITDRSTENTRAVKSTEGMLPPESHAHQRQASLHEPIVDRLAIPEQSRGTANVLNKKQLEPIPILQSPSYGPMGAYGTYRESASIDHDATRQVAPQLRRDFEALAQWASVPLCDQPGSDNYQPSHLWVRDTAVTSQEDQSLFPNRYVVMEQCGSDLSPALSSQANAPPGSSPLLEDSELLPTPHSRRATPSRNTADHDLNSSASIIPAASKRRSASLPYNYMFPVTEAPPFQRTTSAEEEKGPLSSLSGPDELTGEDVFAWLSRRGEDTSREAEKQAHLPPGLSALLYRPHGSDRSYIPGSFAVDNQTDGMLTQGTTDTATFPVPTIWVSEFTALLDLDAPLAEVDDGLDSGTEGTIDDSLAHVSQISRTMTEYDDEGEIGSARLAESRAVLGEGADSSTRPDGTSPGRRHEAAVVDHNMRQSWADMVESKDSRELP